MSQSSSSSFQSFQKLPRNLEQTSTSKIIKSLTRSLRCMPRLNQTLDTSKHASRRLNRLTKFDKKSRHEHHQTNTQNTQQLESVEAFVATEPDSRVHFPVPPQADRPLDTIRHLRCPQHRFKQATEQEVGQFRSLLKATDTRAPRVSVAMQSCLNNSVKLFSMKVFLCAATAQKA